MPGINGTMHTVRELVGKEGTQVFEKNEFLNKVKGINKEVAKIIEESVSGVTNPTFEVFGKAAANYNIAAFRIKNGNEVIGTGSTSISFSDVTKSPEIKSRMSLPDGVQSRGKSEGENFVNVTKEKNGKELVTEHSMKDGKLLYSNRFDTNVARSEITKYGGSDIDNMFIEYNKNGEVVSSRYLRNDYGVERFGLTKRLGDNSVIEISSLGKGPRLQQSNRLDKKIVEITDFSYRDSESHKFTLKIDNGFIYFDKYNKVLSTSKSLESQELAGKSIEEFIEKYNLHDIWGAYQKIQEEVIKTEKLLPGIPAKYPDLEKVY